MEIPARFKESLDAYSKTGRPTGGFLGAVLANDLFEALGRADTEAEASLGAIVRYIYNKLPMACWGNYDKVEAWKGFDRGEPA